MSPPDRCRLCGAAPAMTREGRWQCECAGGINAGPERDSEHEGWDMRQRTMADKCAVDRTEEVEP